MAALTSPRDAGLVPIPPTANAEWLPPSAWPPSLDHLFQPRPFDTSIMPAVISRYETVLATMIDRDRIWQHQVPLTIRPPETRHCTLDAAWGADGQTHTQLRDSLRAINRGTTADGRRFTQDLTRHLLTTLMSEPPPWDLARVIYETSMQLIIRYTLQAPPLLPDIRRLREIVRDVGTAPGGFFGIQRQPEVEDLLTSIADHPDELPKGGLARDLVDLRRDRQLSREQFAGQLFLVVASSETQATAAASLFAMLIECGEYGYAGTIIDQAEPMRRLIAEGGRRSLVFPASLVTPAQPVTFDGRTAPAGTPVQIAYAAANLDPAVFEDPLRFDPRRQPGMPHLAFGQGRHRCQGATGAEQFVEDTLRALYRGLPEHIRLEGDVVLRETAGISLAVPCLPVTPG